MSDTPRTDKEIERHDGEDSFQHYIDFAKGLERELAYKEAALFEAAKWIQRLREDLTIEHQNFLKTAKESQAERDRAIAAEKKLAIEADYIVADLSQENPLAAEQTMSELGIACKGCRGHGRLYSVKNGICYSTECVKCGGKGWAVNS